MIRHLKHIISAFIFLSLLGVGGNLPVSVLGVRYIKETEWVTKANFSEKVTKCCDYIQHIFNRGNSLILKPWSGEYHYYHQKVKVQILSQIKIQSIVTPKRLLFIKLNYSERYMEDYLIS